MSWAGLPGSQRSPSCKGVEGWLPAEGGFSFRDNALLDRSLKLLPLSTQKDTLKWFLDDGFHSGNQAPCVLQIASPNCARDTKKQTASNFQKMCLLFLKKSQSYLRWVGVITYFHSSYRQAPVLFIFFFYVKPQKPLLKSFTRMTRLEWNLSNLVWSQEGLELSEG